MNNKKKAASNPKSSQAIAPANENTGIDYISALPDELLNHIFSYIITIHSIYIEAENPIKALYSVGAYSRVCKKWRQILKDDKWLRFAPLGENLYAKLSAFNSSSQTLSTQSSIDRLNALDAMRKSNPDYTLSSEEKYFTHFHHLSQFSAYAYHGNIFENIVSENLPYQIAIASNLLRQRKHSYEDKEVNSLSTFCKEYPIISKRFMIKIMCNTQYIDALYKIKPVLDTINIPDREFAAAAVRINGEQLQNFPEFQDDLEIVKTALCENLSAIQHVNAALLSKDLISSVLSHYSKFGCRGYRIRVETRILPYLTQELQADPEIVLAAVKLHYRNLQDASETFKANEKAALAAIKSDHRSYDYIATNLKNNIEFTKKAFTVCKKLGRSYKDFPAAIKANKEITLLALKSSPEIYCSALNSDTRENRDFTTTALRHSGLTETKAIIKVLPEKFRKDFNLRNSVLARLPSAYIDFDPGVSTRKKSTQKPDLSYIQYMIDHFPHDTIKSRDSLNAIIQKLDKVLKNKDDPELAKKIKQLHQKVAPAQQAELLQPVQQPLSAAQLMPAQAQAAGAAYHTQGPQVSYCNQLGQADRL
ncbi:F-box-like domain-containing protein [Gammaproteobacteria bacterium]|nr:F-box-like domain-containing protein [Gammaproteobacteria bacterium]